MLTYEQLDVIADAYIPILFIVSVFVLSMGVSKLGFKRKLLEFGAIVISIIIVYIFMVLDNVFRIWPAFELDYSTHTALSLVFVVYLSSKNKTLLALSILSFLFYVLLMIYQKYHTIEDIISTSVVLKPIFWLLMHRKILTKIAHRTMCDK
jgi:hypothetical protein